MNYNSLHTELNEWLPKSKTFYHSNRNYDIVGKQTTSRLSSAISSGMLSESDIINSLHAFGIKSSSNKFLEEVFWRIYFRGYFETHPTIWSSYKDQLSEDKAMAHSDNYQIAISSNTGIECFDNWVSELLKNGYLHNHTRMWFASIWTFTLKLPWTLGCDLFMQHLIDADEASNVLSWRWVAGLHTSKKPYVARANNINKYTRKYNPINQLNESPKPIYEDIQHEFVTLDHQKDIPSKCSLLMIDNHLDINALGMSSFNFDNFYVLDSAGISDRKIDRISINVRNKIIDKIARKIDLSPRYLSLTDLSKINGKTLLSNFIRSGELKDKLLGYINKIEASAELIQIHRAIDKLSWKYCKGGFFKLKTNISDIVNTLLQPTFLGS
jgi:deoxyribodipyrimidine photo-lyase